jgi:acyl-CoA synthetase (AMP-forming)/AMP-acid ligase II
VTGAINQTAPVTLTNLLLDYASGAAGGRGRTIFTSAAGESIRSHADTALDALRVARALRERGCAAGDVIFLALPTSESFLVPFFGAVLAGCIPCCVPAIAEAGDADPLSAHLSAAIDTLTPRFFVTTPAAAAVLARWRPALVTVTPAELERAGMLEPAAVHRPQPDDVHHLQLTSGSTGRPKAAAITHRNVISNILLTAQAGRARIENERAALWLPLFHDMGLIGLLGSFVHGIDVVLQAPDEFIRSPMTWLRNLSHYRATTSAAPNFALAYCVRRFRADLLRGVDLRGFRALVVGAERVHLKTLREFTEKFSAFGFRGDMIFPCYGLAELTLAVTVPDGRHGHELGRNIRAETLSPNGDAQVAARLTSEPVLSMGPPLGQTHIEIRDPAGVPLAEGQIGEIHVSSVCLMREYFRDPERTRAVIRDGYYATGDLGLLRDGELYVLGRMKELIILRGRNYYPHEFEECAARHPMVAVGRVAAFAVDDASMGSERLVIAIEPENYRGLDGMRRQVQELLRAEFGFGAHELCFVRRGGIPRTTSRKIQRVECARSFAAGTLDVLAHESHEISHIKGAVPQWNEAT